MHMIIRCACAFLFLFFRGALQKAFKEPLLSFSPGLHHGALEVRQSHLPQPRRPEGVRGPEAFRNLEAFEEQSERG